MNYNKIYFQIIERAKNRTLIGYKERHHVMPKCLGGNNDKENLVDLTAKEHFLCHQLLCEIYPTNDKLKYALFLMNIGKQLKEKYTISSRTYERLKIEHSLFLKGKKHSLETKRKISKTKKGKKLSKETIAKMVISRLGKKHKNHIRGKKHKLFGYKQTSEHSQKIGKSRLGKPSTHPCKPIIQLNKDNVIIKEYESITEAKRITKIKGIPNALTGITKTAGKYKWIYKNDNT